MFGFVCRNRVQCVGSGSGPAYVSGSSVGLRTLRFNFRNTKSFSVLSARVARPPQKTSPPRRQTNKTPLPPSTPLTNESKTLPPVVTPPPDQPESADAANEISQNRFSEQAVRARRAFEDAYAQMVITLESASTSAPNEQPNEMPSASELTELASEMFGVFSLFRSTAMVSHYNSLLHIFQLAGDYTAASNVFKDLVLNAKEREAFALQPLANSALLPQPLRPNIESYKHLARAMCEGGMMKAALALYREMIAQGIHPDEEIFLILLYGLMRKGLSGSSEAVFNVYLEARRVFTRPQSHKTRVPLIIYQEVLSSLRADHDVPRAVELYEHLKADIRFASLNSPRIFNIMIDMLTYSPHHRIEKVPREKYEGLVRKAAHIFNDMLILGIKPNLNTFSNLIRGFYSIQDLESMEKAYDKMLELKIAPTPQIFHSILTQCMIHRNFKLPLRLYDYMSELEIPTDPDTLSAMAGTFIAANRVDVADALLKEFSGPWTFRFFLNILVGYAALRRELDGVRWVIDEMSKRRLIPNEVLLRQMAFHSRLNLRVLVSLWNFAQAKLLRAVTLAQRSATSSSSSVSANAAAFLGWTELAFARFAYGFAKNERLDLVQDVLATMKQYNIAAGPPTYSSIIGGLILHPALQDSALSILSSLFAESGAPDVSSLSSSSSVAAGSLLVLSPFALSSLFQVCAQKPSVELGLKLCDVVLASNKHYTVPVYLNALTFLSTLHEHHIDRARKMFASLCALKPQEPLPEKILTFLLDKVGISVAEVTSFASTLHPMSPEEKKRWQPILDMVAGINNEDKNDPTLSAKPSEYEEFLSKDFEADPVSTSDASDTRRVSESIVPSILVDQSSVASEPSSTSASESLSKSTQIDAKTSQLTSMSESAPLNSVGDSVPLNSSCANESVSLNSNSESESVPLNSSSALNSSSEASETSGSDDSQAIVPPSIEKSSNDPTISSPPQTPSTESAVASSTVNAASPSSLPAKKKRGRPRKAPAVIV